MITDINVVRIPDFVRIKSEQGDFIAQPTGESFSGRDVSVRFSAGEALAVSVVAQNTPLQFIGLRWNGSFASGVRFLGDAVERGYGNLEWRGTVPHRLMPWYCLASDTTDTVGFGVQVRPGSFAFWAADQQGVTLWLDTRCGGDGVILSGKVLEAATVVSAQNNRGENAFRFLHRFCTIMCTDPLLPKEPVYGSNNWYYAYGNSSAEEILRDTDLLAELTQGLENRPYMVIDDCWQPLSLAHGAAGRPYDCGNSRFPDMPGLAAAMKAKGVKPGIWIRPLETYEMFIPDHVRCDRNRKYLDLTEPDALQMIAEDVNRVTSWGYELVKFDFATIDALGTFGYTPMDMIEHVHSGWHWHDRSVTNAQAIVNFYRVIRENSNGAVLIGCNVVGHLAAGLVHAHRSGDDTSGFEWGRTMVMGVNTLAFRLAQNRAFFSIDADCVGITGAIDWKMNKQFLELVAHSGSPLFCSMKPEAITEDMKADLKQAFAVNSVQQDDMEPLDWFDTCAPTQYLVNGEKALTFRWIEDAGFAGFHK